MDTSLNSRVSRLVAIVLAAAVTASVTSVSAQTYRLSEADGTVHFTNAPTDPRYQRLAGFTSGTAAGWPKLPRGDPSWFMPEMRGAAERYGVSEQLVSAVIRGETAVHPRAAPAQAARRSRQLMP